jgi:hypothetical protein
MLAHYIYSVLLADHQQRHGQEDDEEQEAEEAAAHCGYKLGATQYAETSPVVFIGVVVVVFGCFVWLSSVIRSFSELRQQCKLSGSFTFSCPLPCLVQ